MLSSLGSKIIFIGDVSDEDKNNLSLFLGHDCDEDGSWAKYSRKNSTFEFAVSSNGSHFIRLPGYSINDKYYHAKEVKTYIEPSGYIAVSGFTLLHRLVANAFFVDFAPYPEKEVNHKDGNKFNNDISNLEMVTHQENISHFFNDPSMQDIREQWVVKHTGRHWTDEQHKKFLASYTRRPWTDEERQQMSKLHKGKKLSPAHVAAIKSANIGNKRMQGRVWVTNGTRDTLIRVSDLASMESQGYRRGRTHSNMPKQRAKYTHSKEFLAKQLHRTNTQEVAIS